MSFLSEPLFIFVAALTVIFAVATVITTQTLKSAICLMGVLFLSAGLYLILDADFLAGTQVLVYVGGVVVLLVFAVMLTHSEDLAEDRPSLLRKLLALLGSTVFFYTNVLLLANTPLVELREKGPANVGVKEIGRALLDTGPEGYVLPFEVISLLLLAVLIAGIVIARKEPE